MKYWITLRYSGQLYSKGILKKEYVAIKKAKFALFQILHIEEKFEMLLENYSEYENELLSIATHYVIFDDFNYQKAHDQRMSISRRIVNFLTAARLFVDQSIHHLSNIYGKNSRVVRKIKDSMSLEYDSHLAYRTLEALRNYVQHRGFPIHSLSYYSSVLNAEPGSDVHTIIIPYLSLVELTLDGKFKKSVLSELVDFGETIDLRSYIREYIDSLGRVMKQIRKVVKKRVSFWDDKVFSLAKSPLPSSEELTGSWTLTVGMRSEAEKESGLIRVFPEFIDRRKQLELKNRLIKSLATHFVSGQVVDPSA